jgi:hypothetical protein
METQIWAATTGTEHEPAAKYAGKIVKNQIKKLRHTQTTKLN